MELKKVSVIIPVYNAEKHLGNCIDSIISQTYRNIEIILINDGSIDESGKVCDEYANVDKRIKVFHKKNSGVSVARNSGIDIANGDYIQFVDSDDYLETNMIERLVKNIDSGIDFLICGYKFVYNDGFSTAINNNECLFEGTYGNYEFIVRFGEFFENYFINPIWNKLYDARKIKNHKLRFLESLSMGEDLLFNIEYIKVCEKIKVIKDSLYYYLNFNGSSITSSYKEDLLVNQQMLFLEIRKFLEENNCYKDKNKKVIENQYIRSIINCLENLYHTNNTLTSTDRNKCVRKVLYDDFIRDRILDYSGKSIQEYFIVFFIKHKLIYGIDYYFEMKNFLKNNMEPVFKRLKKLNNKEHK